jgi:tRNA(Phe) wybutosine-synthesizing methylase Tyw3
MAITVSITIATKDEQRIDKVLRKNGSELTTEEYLKEVIKKNINSSVKIYELSEAKNQALQNFNDNFEEIEIT